MSFEIYDKICLFHGRKLIAVAHWGHQTVIHYGQLSYSDWRITATQEFPWFNLFISYLGTTGNKAYYDVSQHTFNASKKHLGAQGVVFGILRTF